MTASILYQKITGIGSFTALTNADADYLAIDPSRCTGLGDAALRTTAYDAAGEDGENIFDALDGQHVITLVGDLICTSADSSDMDAYFAAVDTLYASLKSALDGMKSTPGDLVTNGGTLKVRKWGPAEDGWQNYWLCSVTFSLIVDVFA